MRIGIITYGLDRSLTGIGRYSIELIQALATLPNGPEIILLTTEHTDSHGLWEKFERHALFGCHKLPGLATLGNIVIRSAAQRLKLGIVHDPTGVTPFLFGAGSAKTIVTVHDIIPLSFPGVSTRADTLIYRHWLPRVLPRVDGVITISEASRKDIMHYLRIPADKIHVTSQCANRAYRPASAITIADVRSRYALPDDYILYVGAIEERKNIRRLLRAYSKLRRSGLEHVLVFVGPRLWKYSDIMSEVSKLNLHEYVMFTGYVSEADLPTIYSGAALFVYPSLYEGFGLPPLEAMACGVPVVTATTSSLPEVAGDAALLVDPHDVDAIAHGMHRVLTERSLAMNLRTKGLARAQQFTGERAAQETLAVYERVLG